MTPETRPKQPPKRFAKLDAIPKHKPLSGFRGAVARLYIARKATIAFVGIVAFASVSGIFLIRGGVPSDPLEVAVAEVSKPSESLIPPEIAQAVEAAKIERIMDQPEAVSGRDSIGAAAQIREGASDVSVPADPANEQEDNVPADASTRTETQEKPEVRKIIPIAEGLDLYRPSDLVMPKQAEAVLAAVDETPSAQFSLPSSGVPSEEEMAGFLKQTGPKTGVIAVIPPQQEGLAPTISLPDTVPVPVSRPAPALAKGTKVEFHIVQGQGVKSGFWLGNKEDPATRRFFVVVAPQLENGETTNWKFTNIADGSAADTDRMAVEVTEDAFVALAKESKEFGKIRNPVLGRGEIGDRNVKWRIASVGGNLIAGWDRETRK